MKIRLGFVSNSSSSSFIIALKKAPTEENLKIAFRNAIPNQMDCVYTMLSHMFHEKCYKSKVSKEQLDEIIKQINTDNTDDVSDDFGDVISVLKDEKLTKIFNLDLTDFNIYSNSIGNENYDDTYHKLESYFNAEVFNIITDDFILLKNNSYI